MPNVLESAKQLLAANETVQYGIFGVIGSSGVFPPQEFLNEFLAQGNDPCDQDGRMSRWKPFNLSPEEYNQLLEWWLEDHPNAVKDRLGAECWDDWVQEVVDRS